MPHNRKSFKVVLITGCSSGFGLRMAARLSATGHRVYPTMRDLSKKQELIDEMFYRGTQAEVLSMDVTDQDSIQEAVSLILEKEGRIDVLVNNAGYGIGGFFEDLTQDEIRAQMETNFFGVQNVTRAVLPSMRQQRSGLIVNMSSISGLYALPCFGAYNASKWALEGFSESLLFELEPFGIHVCLIEPGAYKTKIFYENRQYAANFFNTHSPYYQTSQVFQKRMNDNIRLDKKDPEEIAMIVEKLISMAHPPFRIIPDVRSRIIYRLKRFLPFSIYRRIVSLALRFAKKSAS